MNSNPSSSGGFKEIIFSVEGDAAYSRFKFESGVHSVQRVPATESQGRIHTSAATVAVLPEAEEVDVEIKPDDVHVDVFRSSGPGGQSVNTTDSAVRMTHKPTGSSSRARTRRASTRTRAKAMKVLRARIYEAERERQEQEQAAERRSQITTGDRSAKIRTYNFPQSRVTDHRIGLTLHGIESVMGGDIDCSDRRARHALRGRADRQLVVLSPSSPRRTAASLRDITIGYHDEDPHLDRSRTHQLEQGPSCGEGLRQRPPRDRAAAVARP